MTRQDEAGARGAARSLARPLIIAVVVVLLIGGYVLFIADRDPPGSVMPEDVGARPAGAGSVPDGAADDRIEGVGNESATDDFIDGSQASDARPSILEVPDGPEPVPGVDKLNVPDRVNDGVTEPGSGD